MNYQGPFRTFGPDLHQHQGNVQPFTQKQSMPVDILDLDMQRVFFTRRGQQMVHIPGSLWEAFKFNFPKKLGRGVGLWGRPTFFRKVNLKASLNNLRATGWFFFNWFRPKSVRLHSKSKIKTVMGPYPKFGTLSQYLYRQV